MASPSYGAALERLGFPSGLEPNWYLGENPISLAAVRGERLPRFFTDGLDLCTIHAIRHHDTFARTTAVVSLCDGEADKRYARARNARLIMSNEVPDMATDDVKPYCIWYPDIASEETYHELVKRYPSMAYSVGRACAVAGYDQLYQELEILPDISIAEEARESSKPGSKAIFDHIMQQPTCYAVMDDYTLSVNIQNPRSPAFMNGDTAVRSTLDVTVSLKDFYDSGQPQFDIAEDGHISEIGTVKRFEEDQATLPPEHVTLFHSPLPAHLPTIIKDPLLIMAAYEGNLDRYVRLRRPSMRVFERAAVLRGIYHNTTFAKWWFLQEDDPQMDWYIRAACLARFIMVNDLSHITRSDPDPLYVPGLIWWPLIPAEETLKELALRRPDMDLQVAMACIAGNYKDLWNWLKPRPCRQLWYQATRCDDLTRNYFVDWLESHARDHYGKDIRKIWARGDTRAHDQCLDAARATTDFEPTTTWLDHEITIPMSVENPESSNIYGGFMEQANFAHWELLMSTSKELMDKIRQRNDGIMLYDDYYRDYWALPLRPESRIRQDLKSK